MIQPLVYTDFYKTDHRRQYPPGTQVVYSNLTPRCSRIPGVDRVVVFGLQAFVKEYLVDRFNAGFFRQSKSVAVSAYQRRLEAALGPGAVPLDHIEALHDLGYLPLLIKALPEGTRCPVRVPLLTIRNTDERFYWLTNFLETLLCMALWHPMTSATIAFEYRRLLAQYAQETSEQPEFVKWQGHDFSMRGQTSLESACASGAAHLLSFYGADTIPAIDWLEEYYGADADMEVIGGSVPATEHSVMCLGGRPGDELENYRRLITEVYPRGIVSIVSDTWDYWQVLDCVLYDLRDDIMARDGKVVIRPDSGDPVAIVCGDPKADRNTTAYIGTVEHLWNTFGGQVNAKGYKQLDPHIGVIYGDGITLDRCRAILHGLKEKGFASTNIVFGIGSYTYQHVSRDTFGFAMKATAGKVNGQWRPIFKDPVTDDGTKRSARGLLVVVQREDDLRLIEDVTPAEEQEGVLDVVYEDGMLKRDETLAEIRARLEAQL